MADRTWNQVDARLYEEDWSAEARLILGVLIARCPNPYGVYEIPTLILKTLFTPEQIESALKELSDVDPAPIKLYRAGKVVWITKKWNRAGVPNEKHCKGAFNEVHGHFEEVWKDFQSLYIKWLRGYNGVSKGIGTPQATFPSDTDTDSESDTDSEKKEKGKSKGDKSPAPPPDPRFLSMVAELFPDMKSADAIIGARTLADIERIDEKNMDDIMPALRWAAHDTSSFWNGINFSNCKTLRDKAKGAGTPKKYENICSDYQKKKVGGSNVPDIQ